MFKKILLAYDGSEPAKKACDRCLEMAGCFSAALSIEIVVRPSEFAEDVETEAIIENARNHFDREIAVLKTRAIAATYAQGMHSSWSAHPRVVEFQLRGNVLITVMNLFHAWYSQALQ